MTLTPRPPAPGDRLHWRRSPIAWLPTVAIPVEPLDRADLDAQAIDLERRTGTRKALGYLTGTAGTPTYRRTHAFLAVARAVEAQAKIAGLGHLHVGTTPCGQMCEPVGAHTAKPWRNR